MLFVKYLNDLSILFSLIWAVTQLTLVWNFCSVSSSLTSFRSETSGGIVICYDCFLRLYKLNYCWVVFSVVGLVNQPCLSVLLFLKYILQSRTAAMWVPRPQLYLVVTEKAMVSLATQVMMGIISTGITEGKGRAGVMIPIPGYSMYQARLLQHNTHQVIPIRGTWRRFPRSLFQAFK